MSFANIDFFCRVHIYQLKDNEKCLKLLCEKDQQTVNLSHDLQEHKQEVEKLQRHVK